MNSRTDPAGTSLLPRLLAALAGLLALWLGCSLTNAPLNYGGPVNLAFNPLGVPVVVVGLVGLALAPARAWPLVWPLAAVLALATAGANFWEVLPIEDGAFQSLRQDAPHPDRGPAAAFLHAVALAPVGVAVAALLPGPRRITPLLLASAGAVVGVGFALESFAVAALGGPGSHLVALAVPASAVVALALARGGHPAGRAVAGQAAVLLALCLLLWIEVRR